MLNQFIVGFEQSIAGSVKLLCNAKNNKLCKITWQKNHLTPSLLSPQNFKALTFVRK
jgi:hypothetical protein